MLSPNTGQPMRLLAGAPATYTLRGEQFTLGGPAWECPATGERYTTNDQDFDFVGQLHHAWRERHGIAKEALRCRRKALGLSAAQVSALLGLGINQYRTYEKTNKLPSQSNARLLRLLSDDRALPALLEAAGDFLTNATRRKLAQHVAQHSPQPLTTALPHVPTGYFDRVGGTLDQLADLGPAKKLTDGGYSYAMAA